MTRKKPVAVLVFGILNLVFGGLGLLLTCCCGLLVGVGYIGLRSVYQQAPPEAQKDLEQLWAAFTDNVPGFVPLIIVSVTASVVLQITQVASGWGLVLIKGWARWLCVIWALLYVVSTSAGIVYQLTVLNPGMEKATKDLERWAEQQQQRQGQRGPAPKFQAGAGTGNPILDAGISLATNALGIIYALAAFVFMLLPQTGQAIARYHGQDEPRVKDGPQDYYDDHYERRRRELDQPPDSGQPPGR